MKAAEKVKVPPLNSGQEQGFQTLEAAQDLERTV